MEYIPPNINVDKVEYAKFSSPAEAVLSHEKVVSARSFEINGTSVVAIITVPIYLKSERDNLVNELQELLTDKTQNQILITYDTEIFRKIKPDIDNKTKLELLKKAQNR